MHDIVSSSFTAGFLCPPSFVLTGQKCYHSTSDKYTWNNGKTYCESLGADLAMIHTPEIQQNVFNYFNALGYNCVGNRKFNILFSYYSFLNKVLHHSCQVLAFMLNKGSCSC